MSRSYLRDMLHERRDTTNEDYRAIRSRTICWQGWDNCFKCWAIHCNRSAPISESGQTRCASASHFTSAICLARISRGTENPPVVVGTAGAPGGLAGTPGIERSSSGTAGAAGIAGCSDNKFSREGRLAQTILQTKANPIRDATPAMAFPEDACFSSLPMSPRIKQGREKITQTRISRSTRQAAYWHSIVLCEKMGYQRTDAG